MHCISSFSARLLGGVYQLHFAPRNWGVRLFRTTLFSTAEVVARTMEPELSACYPETDVPTRLSSTIAPHPFFAVGMLHWTEFLTSFTDASQPRSSTGSRTSGASSGSRPSSAPAGSPTVPAPSVNLSTPLEHLRAFLDAHHCSVVTSAAADDATTTCSGLDHLAARPWHELPLSTLSLSAASDWTLFLHLSAALQLPAPRDPRLSLLPETTAAALTAPVSQPVLDGTAAETSQALVVALHFAAAVVATSIATKLLMITSRRQSAAATTDEVHVLPTGGFDTGLPTWNDAEDDFQRRSVAPFLADDTTSRSALTAIGKHVDVVMATRLGPYFAAGLRQALVRSGDIFAKDIVAHWPCIEHGLAPWCDRGAAFTHVERRGIKGLLKAFQRASFFSDASGNCFPPSIAALLSASKRDRDEPAQPVKPPPPQKLMSIEPNLLSRASSLLQDKATVVPSPTSAAATNKSSATAKLLAAKLRSLQPQAITATAVASQRHGFLVSRSVNSGVSPGCSPLVTPTVRPSSIIAFPSAHERPPGTAAPSRAAVPLPPPADMPRTGTSADYGSSKHDEAAAVTTPTSPTSSRGRVLVPSTPVPPRRRGVAQSVPTPY
jgi:hypothetical protein